MSRLSLLEGVLIPDPREPVASLPFEVSEGCTRIDIRLEHEADQILDLGLLDPRAGTTPTEDGFRGWSGGARQSVFVALREATPGYLPGAIPAGRWSVMLGRAKVDPSGCRYRVEIRLTHGVAEEPLPEFRATRVETLTIPADAPWLPGDLQSHTHHSDAQGSIAELLAAAADRGLRFLAITDHNTVSHHRELARWHDSPVLPIAGMELTSYQGHANIWGAAGWVDFRVSDDAAVEAAVARAHALGGVVSINHPKDQPGCIGCDWSYAIPTQADALEVWQGPWWQRNWVSLARYDALLAQGRRLSLVGGSDRHQPAGVDSDPDVLRVGSPTTWLQLPELSVAGVLSALKLGRTSVSESPQGPRVTLRHDQHDPRVVLADIRGGVGERLRWIGAGGVLDEHPIAAEGLHRYQTPVACAFIRAEIVAERTLAARCAELERWSRVRALPYGITLADVHAHPWRVALSAPLFPSAPATGSPH